MKKQSMKNFIWLTLLCLTACSDHRNIVIQPGTFSDDWPSALRGELKKNKQCSLDQINGIEPHQRNLSFKTGETLSMSGWIYSETDGTPPEVYIQLVGPALTYTALAQNRAIRTDVNSILELDPNWSAGFSLQAIQNAEPSEYHVEILQPGPHGVERCDTMAVIKIDPTSSAK